ncbi:MAG: hypothetical protein JOZ52_10640 [Acidobacteria bacterium]|nr:hypothetical protein [Acidobacteriota bacterium]
MPTERQILRNTKLRYKEELAGLKSYLNELSNRCDECNTAHEHVHESHMKVSNDVQYYEGQIKAINARLKALNVKKPGS